MKAVHFGAGNIGRGFLGQLYFQSGYEVVFVDVVPHVIEALNREHQYVVEIVDEQPAKVHVQGVRAVDGRDVEAVAHELAGADIASTAVGVHALPFLATPIALAISERFKRNAKPLDIILCENILRGESFMRDQVGALLPPELQGFLADKVGFVEASIGRMVPVMKPDPADPLRVCVEAFCELPVDANGFRGELPPIKHLLPKPNFEAYVERKLFVHNCGHASAAYLGHLKGYEFVWQAMQDPWVRPIVDGAMAETCLALHRKHGLDLDELNEHSEDLKRRFQNKALGDQVARVGGDPLRKLGPNDRLVAAMVACVSQGIEPDNVATAVAAALRFDIKGDKPSQQLQELRRHEGALGVLNKVCELDSESNLAKLVMRMDARLPSRP